MWTPDSHYDEWELWTLSLQVSLKAPEAALDYFITRNKKNMHFSMLKLPALQNEKQSKSTYFDDFMATYLSWIWIFMRNAKATLKCSADASASLLQNPLVFTSKRKVISSYIFYIPSSVQQATKLKLFLGFSFGRRHQYKNQHIVTLLAHIIYVHKIVYIHYNTYFLYYNIRILQNSFYNALPPCGADPQHF